MLLSIARSRSTISASRLAFPKRFASSTTHRRTLRLFQRQPGNSLMAGAASHKHFMGSDAQGTDVSIVYVTVPPPGANDVAKKLASSVIENKLAACVNIVPGITSVYWWEGKVEESAEQLLIMKTQTPLVEQLTKHVQSNHPYDECEVISTAVTGGSPSYLKWVRDSTQEALTPPNAQ